MKKAFAILTALMVVFGAATIAEETPFTFRNGFAGLLQDFLCLLPQGVQAGWIAVILPDHGCHGFHGRFTHPRCGGVVRIDQGLVSFPTGVMYIVCLFTYLVNR